jgi:hypothetical protein
LNEQEISREIEGKCTGLELECMRDRLESRKTLGKKEDTQTNTHTHTHIYVRTLIVNREREYVNVDLGLELPYSPIRPTTMYV